jgi:hypothetical protein
MESYNNANGKLLSSNADYLSSSALEMRLETSQIIEKIKVFLSGQFTYSIQDENTGKIIIKQAESGIRLMNDEGVSHIVNYISSIINPSVVQGNYTDDWYRERIEQTHKNLCFIIAVNSPTWKIKSNARHSIISFLMELVIPFLSRLIDNEERKSYTQTLRSIENSTTNYKDGGILSKARV